MSIMASEIETEQAALLFASSKNTSNRRRSDTLARNLGLFAVGLAFLSAVFSTVAAVVLF